MPFDGSGNFNRVMNWVNDAAASVKIRSDRHDQEDNNFASGLSQCITKNGETQVTADIAWNGRRIINLGTPVNPQDAATKDYVDSLRNFTTSLNISGADANGRLNFTSPTGANGLSWTTINACWIARPAVTNQSRGLVALNNAVDASGNDVMRIDVGGIVYAPWIVSTNTSFDGANWRTIAAGFAGGIQVTGNTFNCWCNDAASSTAYQQVTVRNFAQLYTLSGGTSRFDLRAAGSGSYNGIFGYVANSARWGLLLGNGGAEGGSNSGSDFTINRYNDAGAGLGTTLSISRANGQVVIQRPTAAAYALAAYGPSGAGGVIGYTADTNYYGILGLYQAGVAAWSFYGVGSAYNTQAWQVSDIRAKHDIASCDCGEAHHKVRALAVHSYTKDGAMKPEMGWMAQDIEQLIPDAVMDVPIPEHDEATRKAIGGDTIKATNDRTMLATLWAAFQHQAEMIEALETKIASLEAKLT